MRDTDICARFVALAMQGHPLAAALMAPDVLKSFNLVAAEHAPVDAASQPTPPPSLSNPRKSSIKARNADILTRASMGHSPKQIAVALRISRAAAAGVQHLRAWAARHHGCSGGKSDVGG